MADWLQLHIVTDRDQAPLAEKLLEDLHAVSVTLDDARDHPILEPDPGQVQLWPLTRITGLFPGDTDPQWLQNSVTGVLNNPAPEEISIEPLAEQVWERAWMDQFHAMRFGKRLWVRPSGFQVDQADAITLDLDPGLAFGTGTHPTTALCLEWLDAHPPANKKVMDFGCGSGILAIAALKLGAKEVVGVDHDTQALEATAANAANNQVTDRLRILHSSDQPSYSADLVLANILSEILIKLEPRLANSVKKGGKIILSGILEDQASSVNQAFEPHFHLSAPKVKEGWVLIEGQRR